MSTIKGKTRSVSFYLLDLIFPKQKNLFLYSSGGGVSYFNNSRYIYEWTKKNAPEIEAVWVTKDKKISDYLNNKYGEGSALLWGKKGSFLMLLRAKVFFITHGPGDFLYRGFNPSPRKFVIQLWHGIGTKRVGFLDNNTDKKKLKKITKKYDYVVSNSYIDQFISMRIFDFPQNKVWPFGSPKIDDIKKRKGTLVKQILYAPTYGSDKLFPFDLDLVTFNEYLKGVDINLLISAHRNDYKDKNLAKPYSNIRFVQQGPVYDIQENINSSDALITDYSSVFWDFTFADKPTIFICKKGGSNEINKNVVFDYSVISCERRAESYEELVNLIDSLSYYEKEMKYKNDILRDIYFDKQFPSSKGSEAIILKLKEIVKFNG